MPLRPVDPRTVGNKGPGHRGRVSYPLLKEFMESGELMAAVEQKGMQQSLMSLRATLTYYIKSRDLPVHVFQRDNEMYLARLDKEMLEDGTVVDVTNWKEIRDASNGANSGEFVNEEPKSIMEDLNKQYDENVNAITK